MSIVDTNRSQTLLALSLISLFLIEAKPAQSAPTAAEYRQFRGGAYEPTCDRDFDIPLFVEIRRHIGRARVDGEEAKFLVVAVGGYGNCTYYRTKRGKIHKIAYFRRQFDYNGKPAKLLSVTATEEKSVFVFLDRKGIKHTIEKFGDPP
jgi:hypothetical protein